MEVYILFMIKNKLDEPVIDGYRKMRQALQDYDIHEWQLEKGYRIPGTIYNMRAENISKMVELKNRLSKYGMFDEHRDSDNFRNYFLEKFKQIDEEIPLQKGKPDYLDDED